MIKKSIHILLSLFKVFATVALWFMLMSGISLGMSEYQKEYYTPTDTPNERFMVGGQRLQDFKDNPKPLDLTPDTECMDSCLKLLDNGNYEYFNDAPLIMTYSEFQVKGNEIIPISFKVLHAGHLFYGVIGAFFGIWFLGYCYKIYQFQNNKQALIAYHKKLAKDIGLLLFCISLAVAGYWILV